VLDHRRDALIEVPVGDLADEPDAQCHLGAEALASEEVAPRVGADPREDEGGDDRGHDSEPDLREAEDRLRIRDDDVRAGDEPAATAERVAVHARQHGRRAAVDRLAHRVEPQRVRDVLLVGQVDGRALPFDVRARAEGLALAGEDDRARVADISERLGQLGDQRRVEGISPVGARERDAQNGTVSLQAKRAHVRAA
jgi:hypothetical protein